MEDIHLFTTKNENDQFELYKRSVINNEEHLNQIKEIGFYQNKLKVVNLLHAYTHSLKIADEHMSEQKVFGYVLLQIKIDTTESHVSSTLFKNTENKEAERMYIELEKEAASNPDFVVALVSTTAVGGIKEAYPNYFADSTDFLSYLGHIIQIK